MPDPKPAPSVAQLDGSPRRRYYTGRDLQRAVTVADLRAMAHRRLPRFVLEYLEGGAEDEASLAAERAAKPLLLKGILHLDDVRRSLDAGVDGVILGSHGGRQLDWAVAPLELLPGARQVVQDRIALYVAGGVRRGTDLLKALALGADAVLAGRAPLYGLCAGGAPGVQRALAILTREAEDALGLLGCSGVRELGPALLARDGPPACICGNAYDRGCE